MEHHARRPVGPGQRRRLPVAVIRQLPGLGINGAGKQLIERSVKHAPSRQRKLSPNLPIHAREIGIHVGGRAIFRNFQSQVPLRREPRRLRVNCGQVDLFSLHMALLLFSNCLRLIHSSPGAHRHSTP